MITTSKSNTFCTWATLSFAKGILTASTTIKAKWVGIDSIIVPVIDDSSKVLKTALAAQMQLAVTNKVPGVSFDVFGIVKTAFLGDIDIVCVGH